MYYYLFIKSSLDTQFIIVYFVSINAMRSLSSYSIPSLNADTVAMTNCPNWSRAIDIILANNLPVKFAACGRLDLDDLTLGSFYATKKIWDYPRQLRKIMLNDLAPRKPIFVSAFDTYGGTLSTLSLNSYPMNSVRGSFNRHSRSREHSMGNSSKHDTELHDYLRILREAMEVIV